MTTLRTVGSIVQACNSARDLSNLVHAYLELWKKYANGVNDVRIPDVDFAVIFMPPSENKLNVRIAYTETHHWSEPTYYDVDSDYFQEGIGADNRDGGCEHYSEDRTYERGISIPYTALLQSKENMEKSIKEIALKDKLAKQEATRQAEIQRLQKELAKLQQKESQQ